jgi:hypothetical protein
MHFIEQCMQNYCPRSIGRLAAITFFLGSSTMPDKWYYIQGKKKTGPILSEELEQLACSGHLSGADMVMKEGDRVWQTCSVVLAQFKAPPDLPSDADDWFYAQDKKKVGPVSFARLIDLALAQELLVNDMVLQGGQAKWRFAGDVPGLFPAFVSHDSLGDEEIELESDQVADDGDGEVEEIDVEVYVDRARSFQCQGDYAQAIAECGELVDLLPDEPEGYNGLARIWATCPEPRFRNGSRAVEYALQAVALTGNVEAFSGRVECAETLAAAYAESGDFATANAVLRWVLPRAEKEDKPRLHHCRLLFLARKPYRERKDALFNLA